MYIWGYTWTTEWHITFFYMTWYHLFSRTNYCDMSNSNLHTNRFLASEQMILCIKTSSATFTFDSVTWKSLGSSTLLGQPLFKFSKYWYQAERSQYIEWTLFGSKTSRVTLTFDYMTLKSIGIISSLAASSVPIW